MATARFTWKVWLMIVHAENPLGSYHGIVGAQTGEVAHNLILRHAEFHQRVLHVAGLVVVFLAVVAGNDDATQLAAFPESGGGFHAAFEVEARVALAEELAAAQHHGHIAIAAVAHLLVAVVIGQSIGVDFRCAHDDEQRNEDEAAQLQDRPEYFTGLAHGFS